MPVVIDHWLRLGPRNASKVEKLSSREVSYLHHTPVRPLLILMCVSISASATHLWLAATPLPLPGASTITSSDILGLIVLHVNMTM